MTGNKNKTQEVTNTPITSSITDNKKKRAESNQSSTGDGDKGTPATPWCYKCRKVIGDQFCYSLGDGRLWHVACLTCSLCARPLDSQKSCFAKDGEILCQMDYSKWQTTRQEPLDVKGKKFEKKLTKCDSCHLNIQPNDFIIQCPNVITSETTTTSNNNSLENLRIDYRNRFRVFHVNCFKCVVCERRLKAGDAYYLSRNGPFCYGHSSSSTTTIVTINNNKFATFNNNNHSLEDEDEKKRKKTGQELLLLHHSTPETNSTTTTATLQIDISSPISSNTPNVNEGELGLIGQEDECIYENGELYYLQGSSRQKRMRTSFKHHQLRTMKAYFSVNHNPDAKDLKSLSEKTGLSKRVLQVWFQNARAKYRRSLMRSELNGQQTVQGVNNLRNGKTPSSLSEDHVSNTSSGNLDQNLADLSKFTRLGNMMETFSQDFDVSDLEYDEDDMQTSQSHGSSSLVDGTNALRFPINNDESTDEDSQDFETLYDIKGTTTYNNSQQLQQQQPTIGPMMSYLEHQSNRTEESPITSIHLYALNQAGRGDFTSSMNPTTDGLFFGNGSNQVVKTNGPPPMMMFGQKKLTNSSLA